MTFADNDSESFISDNAHNRSPLPAISFTKRSALADLTPDQQEQLFEWLQLYSPSRVLQLVAAPPPQGFGLVVHLTTLRRFHTRALVVFQKRLAQDASEDYPDRKPAASPEEETLQNLRQSALQLATLYPNTTADFSALSLGIARLKQIEHRERELDLASKRFTLQSNEFQFKAARSALDHLDDLLKIAEAEDDETAKLIAARQAMFG